MPHSNSILDFSPIAAAGHVIPHNFQPISVSQFMDDLSTEENAIYHDLENNFVSARTTSCVINFLDLSYGILVNLLMTRLNFQM
jgi:hypothetical protein